MISREKCLEMVEEIGLLKRSTLGDYTVLGNCSNDNFVTLINRAYAEGQKDMRERAAKVCLAEAKVDEHKYEVSMNPYNEGGMDTGYLLEEVINKLEIE